MYRLILLIGAALYALCCGWLAGIIGGPWWRLVGAVAGAVFFVFVMALMRAADDGVDL